VSNNKIFILLPDGVGLRNFAFTNFNQIGLDKGYDIFYWNNTPFDLTNLGLKEIKIINTKTHLFTDSYKNARKHIELNLSIRAEKDTVYDTYRFPLSSKTIKIAIKNSITKFLIMTYSSAKGLELIRERIKKQERKTTYYQDCLTTLKKEQPAMVFCTTQRPASAIGPILAAQELGIPTATFIFSWDNLPKATMVVETDFYFVWSKHMKKELLHYYSYIKEKQVFITGTPQFELHFDKSKLLSREIFFQQYQLDSNKKYICYSGDDVTTCPDDPKYLEDVARAVRELTVKGNKLGIIFRRCPVDFSDRFDVVLENYKDVIVPIAPQWERKGVMWDTVLPTMEDLALQINTIAHTEMVVNLGSSMVFDYIAYYKSCLYINYDVERKKQSDWSVKKIYNYVHFRSMPHKDAVIWLSNKEEIARKIEKALKSPQITVNHARDWFKVINQHPPQEASIRIWNCIGDIVGG
jgi:hypothetical protein